MFAVCTLLCNTFQGRCLVFKTIPNRNTHRTIGHIALSSNLRAPWPIFSFSSAHLQSRVKHVFGSITFSSAANLHPPTFLDVVKTTQDEKPTPWSTKCARTEAANEKILTHEKV
jgi:hypothetical protein